MLCANFYYLLSAQKGTNDLEVLQQRLQIASSHFTRTDNDTQMFFMMHRGLFARESKLVIYAQSTSVIIPGRYFAREKEEEKRFISEIT